MTKAFITFFLFFTTFFLQSDTILSVLEKIHRTQIVKVILEKKEPSFYQEFGLNRGLYYDIVQEFAKELGASVEFVTIQDRNKIPYLLQTGHADMALVDRIITPEGSSTSLLSNPYLQTRQMVACKRGGTNPKTDDDLLKFPLLIPNHMPNAHHLAKSLGGEHKQWRVTSYSVRHLFQKLSSQKSGCLLVNEKDFVVLRRHYPNLKEIKMFPKEWGVGAEFAKYSVNLHQTFNKWLALNQDWVASLEHNYYERLHELTYADLRIFHHRIQARLPKFLKYFQEAGRRYQLPWQLLAAQAYQESHWNPNARSKTGVRGVMMLTKVVAKELDVNRIDPIQSIFGGTRYLKSLIARVPKNVAEKDRIWFALAAYNVGMGHVRDAQKLAKREGKDSGNWQAVRSVLPKLAKKEYYTHLKYGYARGYEAVTYVRWIHEFYAILLQYQNQHLLSPIYL